MAAPISRDEPTLLGDLIPGSVTTPAQPADSSSSDVNHEELQSQTLDELRSYESIQITLNAPQIDSAAFLALVSAVESSTRFKGAKAHLWASRLSPDMHQAHKRQLEATQQEREAARAAAEVSSREHHLRKGLWPLLAGRFVDARLESLQHRGTAEERERQRRVWEAIRELDLVERHKTGKNIVIFGPPGGGKTHLLFAMARKLFMKLEGKVVFKNGAMLRQESRNAVMESAAAESAYLSRIIETPLLLLDDPAPVGQKELTDSQADVLYRIVDQRWVNNRPTWISVNLPMRDPHSAAITAMTGPVWDRMRDGAVVIACNWESYRTHEMLIQ